MPIQLRRWVDRRLPGKMLTLPGLPSERSEQEAQKGKVVEQGQANQRKHLKKEFLPRVKFISSSLHSYSFPTSAQRTYETLGPSPLGQVRIPLSNVIPFLSNFLPVPVMVNFSKVDVGSEDQIQHSFLLGFPERKRQLPSSVLCLLTWNESSQGILFLFQVMEEVCHQ